MRRIYFLLFVLLSGLAFAGNVSEEQARKAAIAFWQSAPLTRGASSATFQMVLQSESLVTRSSGMESAYYVFDNTSGPGFVIVAGDDVAMPILAYSKDGWTACGTKSTMPVGMGQRLRHTCPVRGLPQASVRR